MKGDDLLLLGAVGLGAYQLLKPKEVVAAETGFTSSGQTIPNTNIYLSTGVLEKTKEISTDLNTVVAKAKEPIGKINVSAAPLLTKSAEIKATTKTILTAYNEAKYVPSSVLAGKPTKTDLQIAANLRASQGYK